MQAAVEKLRAEGGEDAIEEATVAGTPRVEKVWGENKPASRI